MSYTMSSQFHKGQTMLLKLCLLVFTRLGKAWSLNQFGVCSAGRSKRRASEDLQMA